MQVFITTKRAMSGYNEGYNEGYEEGYNEGYEEARKEFSKELSPKKMKLENTLDIHEYTKEVCDKKQIIEHVNLAKRQQTSIDIYYDGGSESGWRIGCKISYMENGKLYVSYWKNTGVNVLRTFKLNKIKIVRNNEYEVKIALKAYEEFHQKKAGEATIKDVMASSAGINGWFNSSAPVIEDDLIQKMQNIKFNIGKPPPKKRSR